MSGANTVHGGRFCSINQAVAMRTWQLAKTTGAKTHVSSATAGGTGRKKGVRDWTGNFGAYGFLPPVMPGSYFDFVGNTGDDEDITLSGKTYGGNALVDQVAIAWNFQGGDILSYTLNFGANGELLEDLECPVPTPGDDPMSILDAGVIKIDGDELANVVSATLTITAANKTQVNSSTLPWTKRRPGPIDWTLAIVREGDVGLEASTDVDVLLPCGNNTYWNLSKGHIIDFTNLQADRESGNIIGHTINIGMSATAGGSLGHIINPSGTTYWPFS